MFLFFPRGLEEDLVLSLKSFFHGVCLEMIIFRVCVFFLGGYRLGGLDWRERRRNSHKFGGQGAVGKVHEEGTF